MPKFNEKKYMKALEEYVKQSILMIEEDYPDADREDFEGHLGDYMADAKIDIRAIVDAHLTSKFGE